MVEKLEEVEVDKVKESDYSIAKTEAVVGHLYPVIADSQGRVIDGHHRLAEDPNWPVYNLPGIKTDTQYLMAKLIANWHRRKLSKEEKTDMLNAIAEETGWDPTVIAEKTGIPHRTILRHLSRNYKERKHLPEPNLPKTKTYRHHGDKKNLPNSHSENSEIQETTHALFKYCKEKEVYWQTAIAKFLEEGLEKEGYLTRTGE